MSTDLDYDYPNYDEKDGDTCWSCWRVVDNASYGQDGDQCHDCALGNCCDVLCYGQGWCMHR